jgi:hypothetical protein
MIDESRQTDIIADCFASLPTNYFAVPLLYYKSCGTIEMSLPD